MDALGGMIRQAGQHVGEPGLWIDVVELGGGHQCVDGSRTTAAFVGAGEGPILAPHGDGAQLALGGVVRHAQAAVVEEVHECRPALEDIVDRFAGLTVFGDLARCSRNQVCSSMTSARLFPFSIQLGMKRWRPAGGGRRRRARCLRQMASLHHSYKWTISAQIPIRR
jgi:hypothetical protein